MYTVLCHPCTRHRHWSNRMGHHPRPRGSGCNQSLLPSRLLAHIQICAVTPPHCNGHPHGASQQQAGQLPVAHDFWQQQDRLPFRLHCSFRHSSLRISFKFRMAVMSRLGPSFQVIRMAAAASFCREYADHRYTPHLLARGKIKARRCCIVLSGIVQCSSRCRRHLGPPPRHYFMAVVKMGCKCVLHGGCFCGGLCSLRVACGSGHLSQGGRTSPCRRYPLLPCDGDLSA